VKSFLLFIFCIAIHSIGYPQGKVSAIKGVITDSASGEPLEQASVSLVRRTDSIVIKQVFSGKNGFEFRRVATGDYLISISFTGYRPDTIRIEIENIDTVYSVNIRLIKSVANLMEVVVRSVIPPVIVKNDTLVYNTNTVKTQPNATIEDLVKKLPGMVVDKNGDIILHGQKVEKIYIDGKEFFLNDPKMATQNLTADMVDAIEAFDNQSDRSRFTGIKKMNANKAINLRLKKDKKTGLSGHITVSAGTMNTYSGVATATYFKGDRWVFGRLSGNRTDNLSPGSGLKQSGNNQSLNYRENIGTTTQLIANYRSSSGKNQAGQLFKRETFFGDSSLLQNRNALNGSYSANHDFNLNITYSIDSLSSIVYSPSVSWQQNKTVNSDSSLIVSEKNGNSYLSNEGQTESRISSHGSNFNNAIAYRRKFNRKGRSFYGVFSQNHQQQIQAGNLYSVVKFYDNAGVLMENKTVDQQYDQKSNGNTYEMNISYTEPIKANQIIDLGYSLNTSSSSSGKKALNYNPSTGRYDLPDTLTTNEFTNHNTQQNFTMGYNYIGKKVQYQLGMSLLYSHLENESNDYKYELTKEHFVNWSPRFSAFYRLARQKNLQMQYSGNSMTPSTEMLQPIPDFSNPFLVKLGNPNLKQQFQHSVNIVYNESNSKKFNNLSLRFGSDYTRNKIVQFSTLSSAGVQELMYVNASGVYNLNSSLNYGFSLNKTKNGGGGITTWMQYNRDINFVNGEQNVQRSFICGQQVNINYQAKDKLYVGLSAAISYSRYHYSIGTNLNTELLSQNYTANTAYILPFSIRVSSDLTLQINGRQGNLPGTTIATWNASVYRTLFRNNKGEIRFTGYDLLNRNKGFSQSTGANFIETRENTILQRYFLLSLRYNFRVNMM